MSRFFRNFLLVVAILTFCRPGFADTEPTEITSEVFVLKVDAKSRATLEQLLESTKPAEAGDVFLAALNAEQIPIQAVSALTVASGYMCKVKAPLSLKVEAVAGAGPGVAVTCDMEFEGLRIALRNVKYRDGEAKLFMFSDSKGTALETVAVLRIRQSSGGSQ